MTKLRGAGSESCRGRFLPAQVRQNAPFPKVPKGERNAIRTTWLMMAFNGVLIAVFLTQSGCAQQQATAPVGADWQPSPMYRTTQFGRILVMLLLTR